jgi:hypothetical protein
MSIKAVEETWNDFWKEIVCKPDGTLNVEQVKKELHDYKIVMDCASKAFDAVTGGRVSKPNTDPGWVEQFAEEHYRSIFEEELKEGKEPS